MNHKSKFQTRTAETPTLEKIESSRRPFSKLNFILMGICLALIVVGFLLMSGGGSSVEGGFNPDIFSTRRIVVGPLLAFLGFLFMAGAIVIPPDYLSKRKKLNESVKTSDD